MAIFDKDVQSYVESYNIKENILFIPVEDNIEKYSSKKSTSKSNIP